MPETRELALSAWVVVLLGVAWRGGIRSVLSTLMLGAGPAVLLAGLFADSLAPITGFFPKQALETAKKESLKLERERTQRMSSGGESLDWLNCLVKQMWPHISKYVEDKLKGYEGMIQGYLPVGGSQVCFTACTLGKEPLRFGPVKPRLVDAKFDGELLKDNGVELEIDISYNSDVDIVLSSPIASVGIADLRINGTLSVIFRPLMSKSPFIGGLEILFTNPPQVDLDFKGLGNVADMPGIYSAVRNAINDAIGGMMVSPKRKAYAISDDPAVDLAFLRSPPPEGILRVTVVKAEKLEGADTNYDLSKTSDPYVDVRIGSTSWRTPVIKKSCNPVWSEGNVHDFFFFSNAQHVNIDVFDEDNLSQDDSLGCVKRCSVHEFLERAGSGKDPVPFALEPLSKNHGSPPSDARLYLHFDLLKYAPLASEGVELGFNRYAVALKIDECDGLPEEGLGAPFTVRLSIKGNSSRSASTAIGWAKYIPSLTPSDLHRITALANNGVMHDVIAEVLGLDGEKVKAFVAAKLPRDASHADCTKWISRLEANRGAREVSTNPQYEEVLRLAVPERGFSAVVELVNKSKKVVGRFEAQLGEAETVEGPFVINSPGDGAPLNPQQGVPAKLHGSFELHGLAR